MAKSRLKGAECFLRTETHSGESKSRGIEMPCNFRIKMLVATVGLVTWGCSMGIGAQPLASNTAMVALHPAIALEKGDKAVGALDFSQPMHVVVTLKLRNEQQLDQYIAKPGFRPLTSGQFQM